MKLLVLVIASESPTYCELLKMWRERIYPSWVTVKYLFARPDTSNEIDISGDSIYVRGDESIIPGIYHKTRKGMQYCLENEEFDYLLRSNLSSFFRFDKFGLFLQSAPRENIVGGKLNINGKYGQFLSGCGYLMSKDVVEEFLEWPFEHDVKDGVHDDLEVACFYKYHKIPPILWEIYMYDPAHPLEEAREFHIRFCYNSQDRREDLIGYRKAIEIFDSSCALNA